MDDTCYFCGEIVPEGRMVCGMCEADAMERGRAVSPRVFTLNMGKDGHKVTVQFNTEGCEHNIGEAAYYAAAALTKHPKADRVVVTFEGDDAVMECITYGARFERIRRITWYLVGTTDRWNDAKQAELKDRVAHERVVAE